MAYDAALHDVIVFREQSPLNDTWEL